MNWKELLKSPFPVLLDGAMGTRLMEKGLSAGDIPESWNVKHPDIVRGIHLSYVEAGSKIIYTNTFGANPLKLKRAGKEKQVEKFNREGVKLAREAAGDRALVAGDIGPTGEFLQPYGEWKDSDFKEAFQIQISALLEEGVDLLVLETFSDLRELMIALEVSRELTSLPVIACMSFEAGKKGYRTIMGVRVEDVVREVGNTADVIGVNCGGITPSQMGEVLKEFKNLTSLPLLGKPNAGKSRIKEGEIIYELDAEEFGKEMESLIGIGVKFIGGCCGTNSQHIKILAERIYPEG